MKENSSFIADIYFQSHGIDRAIDVVQREILAAQKRRDKDALNIWRDVMGILGEKKETSETS